MDTDPDVIIVYPEHRIMEAGCPEHGIVFRYREGVDLPVCPLCEQHHHTGQPDAW